MPAGGDVYGTLRLPPSGAGLPASGHPGQSAVYLLAVKVNVDRPRRLRRVECRQHVVGRDGEVEVVLGLVRLRSGVPNTCIAVGVPLAVAHADVAPIEPIGPNRETRRGLGGEARRETAEDRRRGGPETQGSHAEIHG